VLFCLDDEFENFFHNQNKEIVLDTLVEVFHVVKLVVFLALLEILHNHGWVHNLLVLIAEQVKKEITWNS